MIKREIHSEFRASISTVNFDIDNVFYTTNYIITNIEDKWENIEISDSFVKLLGDTVLEVWSDFYPSEWADVEKSLADAVTRASNPNDIVFAVDFIQDEYFEELNEFIISGDAFVIK